MSRIKKHIVFVKVEADVESSGTLSLIPREAGYKVTALPGSRR